MIIFSSSSRESQDSLYLSGGSLRSAVNSEFTARPDEGMPALSKQYTSSSWAMLWRFRMKRLVRMSGCSGVHLTLMEVRQGSIVVARTSISMRVSETRPTSEKSRG